MGTWGTALFSDDLAADVREAYRDLLGEGLSAAEAAERLIAQHASSVADPDEAPVFWLALAATQWKLGRLDDRTLQEALRAIDSGDDLRRWSAPADRKKREAVLAKLREQLLSPQPPAKRIPRRILDANDWEVGEVVGLRLRSGNWALMRTIDHFVDKGGRYALVEFLDWSGAEIPSAEAIAGLPVLGAGVRSLTQYMLAEPRVKREQERLRRLGIRSTPSQKRSSFVVLLWKRVDALLEEEFGMA